MACPPVPPQGVDPHATPEQILALIGEAERVVMNATNEGERQRALMRVMALHRYQTELVNCHMSNRLQELTAQVAELRTSLESKDA
jgi:hypothetical protein